MNNSSYYYIKVPACRSSLSLAFCSRNFCFSPFSLIFSSFNLCFFSRLSKFWKLVKTQDVGFCSGGTTFGNGDGYFKISWRGRQGASSHYNTWFRFWRSVKQGWVKRWICTLWNRNARIWTIHLFPLHVLLIHVICIVTIILTVKIINFFFRKMWTFAYFSSKR